jgi:hypothetical protein
MTNVRWYWVLLGFIAVLAVVPACAKNDYSSGGGGLPTATPSGSPTSPPPSACPTENPNTSGNLVIVDETLQAEATSDPTYGSVNGYAVEGSPAGDAQAAIISEYYPNGSSSPTPITPNNIIQFTNVDSSGVYHSAVSITPPWPGTNYQFPTALASPSANTTIGNGTWSTGLWPPLDANGNQCFSQTFTLKQGVWYFGDYNYYDSALMRDVIVVSAAGAARHRKVPIRRIH